MIDSVRSTVMAVANKNNFGYITPSDFNLYAKQAQLDIFEDYFYRYNLWIAKRNNRTSGTGYSDLGKNLEEVIDSFSVTADMVVDVDNVFFIPDDYYLLNKVMLGNIEIEKVSQNKILNLLSSNITTPTLDYPCYTMEANKVEVFPVSVASGVKAQYIRVPAPPKWTHETLPGGEPLFKQSASDYKDFEIPKSDEYAIVDRILQYVGISLRDKELERFGVTQEIAETQQEG